MTLPLDGVRLIDMTKNGPGLYAAMLLADMGADVIKVEEVGEPTGRRAEQAKGAASLQTTMGRCPRDSEFYAPNRNKRSICLNLKDPAARDVFLRLAKTSDVVLEGFRPGVTKRLGIGYEALSQLNPRIIYCALTGYGQDGPYRDLVGHDLNYISFGGALAITGKPDEAPTMPGFQLGDFGGGGLHAVIGILLALMARERTGRGQVVDIAMTDGVISFLSTIVSDYLWGKRVMVRGGENLNGGAPFYNVYECKDGKYLSLGIAEPWFFANLCRELGHEEFIPLQHTTGEPREKIFQTFRQIFKTKTRDEWFNQLSKIDTCVGKVYTMDELASDPHIRHRKMLTEFHDPKLGAVPQVGVGIKLSDTPGSIRSIAPKQGQHTEEVLRSLKYTPEQIAAMRQGGAVK
ncbi:MAG: CaiB/BaiF CoA-transferase family protein [Dehalococcoidia bacterium]|nr:CaiB/BaiF CoA-transferase family protein [Dehalococcoidia bacterium]